MEIERTRWVTGPLALFDLGLGGTAAFAPGLYMRLMHTPDPGAGHFMLQRTGVLWLVFALCQAIACVAPRRLPQVVLVVAALRLMDVPADLVYLATTAPVTAFGWLSLLTVPVINAAVGGFLLFAWSDHVRRRDASC